MGLDNRHGSQYSPSGLNNALANAQFRRWHAIVAITVGLGGGLWAIHNVALPALKRALLEPLGWRQPAPTNQVDTPRQLRDDLGDFPNSGHRLSPSDRDPNK